MVRTSGTLDTYRDYTGIKRRLSTDSSGQFFETFNL